MLNRIPGMVYFPTTPVSTGKDAGGKKYAGHKNASIHWFQTADSANLSVTATVNTLRRKYAPTVSSRLMYATAAVS